MISPVPILQLPWLHFKNFSGRGHSAGDCPSSPDQRSMPSSSSWSSASSASASSSSSSLPSLQQPFVSQPKFSSDPLRKSKPSAAQARKHRTRIHWVAASFLFVFMFARTVEASSHFQFGSCGPFLSDARYAMIDFVLKLLYDRAVLSPYLPDSSFFFNISAVSIESDASAASIGSSVLPLFLGAGPQAGRIYNPIATDPVVALSGCLSERITISVAQLAQRFATPFVSGVATSAALSDTDTYSYFARTAVASASPETLAYTASYYDFTDPIVVYDADDSQFSGESDTYFDILKEQAGRMMFRQLTFGLSRGSTEDSIAYASVDEIRSSFGDLTRIDEAPTSVTILMADEHLARSTICVLKSLGVIQNYTTILLSEGLCSTDALLMSADARSSAAAVHADYSACSSDDAEYNALLEGSLCAHVRMVEGESIPLNTFLETITCDDLAEAGMPSDFPCDNNLFTDPQNLITNAENWYNIFDAMFVILYSISTLAADGVPKEEIKGQRLFETLTRASFEQGASGMLKFTTTGERVWDYYVWNLQFSVGEDPTLVHVGTFSPDSSNISFNESALLFKGGSSSPPEQTACDVGEEWRNVAVGCTACDPGTVSVIAGPRRICENCDAGLYRSEGMTACEVCPAGYYCPEGSAEPTPCGHGHACIRASSEPADCLTGEYADTETNTECFKCPVGTWSNETLQSECISCADGLTTLAQGTVRLSECVCSGGYYETEASSRRRLVEDDSDVTCRECPEALLCEEANTTAVAIRPVGQERESPFPLSMEGYMAEVSSPLQPYKCKVEEWCPGGAPGACSVGRDPETPGCGKCLSGYYENDNVCKECGDSMGFLFFVLAGIAATAGLVVFGIMISRQSLLQARAWVTCIIVAGLTVSSVQTLGVFSNLSVRWVSPLPQILAAMSVFTFDLQTFKVECMVGVDSIGGYVLSTYTGLFAAVIILITLRVKKMFVPSLKYRTEAINAVGSLFQLFFVTMVITVAKPFICYPHPNNVGYSMVSSPAVMCFQGGEHTWRMATGVAGFLVLVVPFFAVVLWATLRHHKVVNSFKQSSSHLMMFRFLFTRYQPDGYFYGTVVLLRGLTTCMVPIFTRDSAAAQVLVLVSVLLCFASIEMTSQPWRSTMANRMDGGILILLVLLLTCAAMGTDYESGADTMIGLMGIAVFALMATAIVGAVVIGIRHYLFPPLLYQWFLSHHKKDASGQARYMEMMLVRRTGKKCFIDSDHLVNLDGLFDIVRSSIGELVLLLTSHTLRRPWCAGEVTITYMTHKRMVLVPTSSFTPPIKQEYAVERIPSFMDGSCKQLTTHGISSKAISNAYEWVLSGSIRTVDCRPSGVHGRLLFEHLVEGIANLKPRAASAHESRKDVAIGTPGSIVVSSDIDDDEATAAAGIIIQKVQMQAAARGSSGIVLLADMSSEERDDSLHILELVETAPVMLVILSEKSIASQAQQQIILCAVMSNTPLVPVTLPQFKIPSEDAFLMMEADFGEIGQRFAWATKKLLISIAVILSTNASSGVLDAQVDELLLRFPADLRQSSKVPKKASVTYGTCNTESDTAVVSLNTDNSFMTLGTTRDCSSIIIDHDAIDSMVAGGFKAEI